MNILVGSKEINPFILHKIAAMKIAYSTLIIGLLLSSCSNKNDYIRDVYVNIDVDLSLPEYSNLTTLGNSIFIEGGNAGIIIYHFGVNEYKVYDRNRFNKFNSCLLRML